MAATARELHYRNGYVDGSLAHELDWTFREGELRHAGELPKQQEAPRKKEKAKVVVTPKIQVRERQHVSAFSFLGIAAVLCMAVLVVMSYVQITVLSSDTVALKKQLTSLETEQVRLTAQYEQMFDLATVQEAAVEAPKAEKPEAAAAPEEEKAKNHHHRNHHHRRHRHHKGAGKAAE